MKNIKKKLLIILGAGSSQSCNMPSVAALDGMMRSWGEVWAAACLQSKAVENPSTAIAIRLAGRCVAAKITADKIKNVQIINERNHEEALKAQQQLREMGIPQ